MIKSDELKFVINTNHAKVEIETVQEVIKSTSGFKES